MPSVRPIRLGRAPIVSVLFEIRFDSAIEGLADLLPGIMYAKLGPHFPTVTPLPAAEIPTAVRQTLPDWQHQTLKQMSSPDGLTNINFGNRNVNIQLLSFYPGWDSFFRTISLVLDAVNEVGSIIGPITRYSLRYQNVLDQEALRSIDGLKLNVQIGDSKPNQIGFSVRGEFDVDKFRAVVQIATAVGFNIQAGGKQYDYSGTLIDVDIMDQSPPADFLSRYNELLTILHEKEKDVFFGLLTEETLQLLEPEWEAMR